MNIELRAKEHIKDLQRHIKANILADVGGKVSDTLGGRLLLYPHNVTAIHRGSRRYHSISILCKGEEAEALCRGEPLRKWCFPRAYNEQRVVVTYWRVGRAFTM